MKGGELGLLLIHMPDIPLLRVLPHRAGSLIFEISEVAKEADDPPR
jgi:hypothetical protein